MLLLEASWLRFSLPCHLGSERAFLRNSMMLHWLQSEKCKRAFSNKAVASLKAAFATCFARARTEKTVFQDICLLCPRHTA